jgi:hypothetical protein
MARPEINPLPYYMVIDITDITKTKILQIARLREAQLWAGYHKAGGLTVIAPVLSGRGFAKLDVIPLQYLYWNTTGLVPNEDYGQLIIDCFNAIRWIAPDLTPEAELEKMLNERLLKLDLARQNEVREKVNLGNQEKPVRTPNQLSTCGYVWEIADKLMASFGRVPTRQELIDECDKEGIHPSTAGTQFYRWKKVRLASS